MTKWGVFDWMMGLPRGRTDNEGRSMSAVLGHRETVMPIVEPARRGATCDVCGGKGSKTQPIVDVFGKRLIRMHAKCGLWISLSAKEAGGG